MRFTEYLLMEGDFAIADKIYQQAEKEVADIAADEGGKGYSDNKVLLAAKKIARKEYPNKAAVLISLVTDKIEKSRRKK